MKKIKIILADPPIVENVRHKSYMPNFGILYLSAYIKEKYPGIEVHYLEPFLDLEQHINAVKEIQPDLYGISFASFLKAKSFVTIEKIKELFPNLTIVAGGAHPTIQPEECLRCGADFCVLGEGEETLNQLLAALFQEKIDFKEIPGIAYMDDDGNPVITAKRTLIDDLDSLPFPDWSLCQEKKYSGSFISKGFPQWTNIISRGCPFNCNFCANPVWKYNKPWIRLRSPENIAEEVKQLYDRGYREITLRCDEFNPNLEWAKDVCRAIKDLGLKKMYFNTLLRASPIDEEFCRLLKEINCWSVNLGIESANKRVLENIGKYISVDEVTQSCKYLRENKIRVFGFFMMFNAWERNGQPEFETLEEVHHTLDFAESMLKRKLLTNISWGFVSPIPGSELYHSCLKHSLIPEDAYLVSKYKKTTIPIPGVSDQDFENAKKRGNNLKIKYTIKNDFAHINLKNYRHLIDRVRDIFF